MNIKNRVIKLEKQTNPAGFCNCRNVTKVETWHQDLTEDADDREPHLIGDAVPETCGQCSRPIQKEEIILQLVDAGEGEKV